MQRNILGILILAGLVGGVSIGYVISAPAVKQLKTPLNAASLVGTGVPVYVATRGVVRSVDLLAKTITLDIESPYEGQTTMPISVMYDERTAFATTLRTPITAGKLYAGDQVSIQLVRDTGPLRLNRLTKTII